jgi:hypothetical protein
MYISGKTILIETSPGIGEGIKEKENDGGEMYDILYTL